MTMEASQINTNYFGFRFEICSVEQFQISNGENAYIFFLNVSNLEAKARLIRVSTATYVTKNREQLEQDIWLSGYLIRDGRIKGNAHRKAGLVFYKRHLSSVVPGDSLYVEVELADSKKKLSLRFDNNTEELTEPWVVSEAQVEDMDVRASPRVLSKSLTRKIERLDAFEERLGITLDKLSVNVSSNYSMLTLSGEVHQSSSGSFSQDVTIIAVLYDAEGTILERKNTTLYARNFAGFDVFELVFYAEEICLIADKIRIFPKAA